MMDFQLTLPHILKRAELYFGRGEIVTRLPDKSFHRTNYRETMRRSKHLAVALQKLGLERGTRVATLCWNHHQHHEAYFGVPCGGFVLHTLNLRLQDSRNNTFRTVQRQNVGITLQVRPQINAGGTIKLDLRVEVSSIAGPEGRAGRPAGRRRRKEGLMAKAPSRAGSDGNERR